MFSKIDNKKTFVFNCLCICMILGSFSFVFIRAHYGFDWSDEPYYTSLPIRILSGQRMFIDMWEVHQFGAVLMTPFLWIYRFFEPNFDGVILYARYLYAFFQLIVGSVIFLTFSKNFGKIFTCMAVCFYIIFAPFSVGSMSYNTMSIGFLTLCACLFINGFYSKDINFFFSGVFLALTVLSFPTQGILLFTFIAIFLFIYKWDKKFAINAFIKFILGGILISLLFVIFVLFHTDILRVPEFLPQLLKDDEHLPRGLISMVIDYFLIIKTDLMSFVLLLIVSSLFAFLVKYLPQKLTDYGRIIILLFFIAASILIFKSAWFNEKFYHINFILLPLTFLLPCLTILCNNKSHRNISLFLASLGLTQSMAIHFGSNNSLYSYSFGYILLVVASFLLIGSICSSLKDKVPMILVVTTIIISLALSYTFVDMMFIKRENIVFRDLSISNLTHKLDNGAGRGIYTNEDSFNKYNEITNAINKYISPDDNVLFTRLLPFGYSMAGGKTSAYTQYAVNIDSERLFEYYDLLPENMPDVIFCINGGYGMNYGNDITEKLLAYINKEAFEKITLDCATIYKRK